MDDDNNTITINEYGAAQPTLNINSLGSDTIYIDPNNFSSGSITSPISYTSNYTWSQPYNNYSVSNSWSSDASVVNINNDGITMKQETDIKIGDRSLKDFMDRVDEHLAILKPAPELEEKWDRLRDLRRQYEECKKDILEKEKMWDILKKA